MRLVGLTVTDVRRLSTESRSVTRKLAVTEVRVPRRAERLLGLDLLAAGVSSIPDEQTRRAQLTRSARRHGDVPCHQYDTPKSVAQVGTKRHARKVSLQSATISTTFQGVFGPFFVRFSSITHKQSQQRADQQITRTSCNEGCSCRGEDDGNDDKQDIRSFSHGVCMTGQKGHTNNFLTGFHRTLFSAVNYVHLLFTQCSQSLSETLRPIGSCLLGPKPGTLPMSMSAVLNNCIPTAYPDVHT